MTDPSGTSAADLIAQTQRELAEVAAAIRSHRFLDAVEPCLSAEQSFGRVCKQDCKRDAVRRGVAAATRRDGRAGAGKRSQAL
jgi:hypothetical protein